MIRWTIKSEPEIGEFYESTNIESGAYRIYRKPDPKRECFVRYWLAIPGKAEQPFVQLKDARDSAETQLVNG